MRLRPVFFSVTTVLDSQAMRHRLGWNRLNRDPRHRKALLKNMVIAMIKHERIMTTLPKAKELRRSSDKMIGLAKRDTTIAKKKAWNWLKHPALMGKLFGTLKERYMTRPGGYTRVLRAPKRQGDNAQMAVVEFVDNSFPPLRPPTEKRRNSTPSLKQAATNEGNVTDSTEQLSEALASVDLNVGVTSTSFGMARCQNEKSEIQSVMGTSV